MEGAPKAQEVVPDRTEGFGMTTDWRKVAVDEVRGVERPQLVVAMAGDWCHPPLSMIALTSPGSTRGRVLQAHRNPGVGDAYVA